jgi:hypothetical protein
MGDRQLQTHRYVVAFFALLVIFFALLCIMLAWAAPDATIGRVGDFADFLQDHNNRDGKLILTLAAVVIILIMAAVLVIELVPPSSEVHVGDVQSGAAAITTRQIAERIDATVAGIENVSACSSTVTRRGKRVEVVLDLDLDAGADLARAADEACRRAHVLVEQQLRIELAARPRARVHYRELRLGSASGQERPPTGWERPASAAAGAPQDEEARDDRRSADASEEAQA